MNNSSSSYHYYYNTENFKTTYNDSSETASNSFSPKLIPSTNTFSSTSTSNNTSTAAIPTFSFFRFPIIIIDKNFRTSSGIGIRALAQTIEQEGIEVIGTTSYHGDISNFVQEQSRASSFILSLNSLEDDLEILIGFITQVRERNEYVPIYVYSKIRNSNQVLKLTQKHVNGLFYSMDDTVEFIARLIIRDAQRYLERIQPPFFQSLLNYAEDGSYSWHCPGHSGGVAFLKSPVGQLFHQFFGENMLRADVCNAVEELGQLLEHNGSIGASERNAARIWNNADECFFITNGILGSMNTVYSYCVTEDDIVIIDRRSCSASLTKSIVLTKCIPVFVNSLTQSEIQHKINQHPLLIAQNLTKLKPRLVTLTQSAQDGIIYNTKAIFEELDGFVDYLHFNEEWVPHASFHSFYQDYHAISSSSSSAAAGSTATKDSLIFSTQAVSEVLAGISQASYIFVRNSQTQQLDSSLFNESYLMHCSTSPQYSIIASCDVGAEMMDSPQGSSLVEESILESLEFRRAMQKVKQEYHPDWWFHVPGPKNLLEDGIGQTNDWRLLNQDYSSSLKSCIPKIRDPLKAFIITPGLQLSDHVKKFDNTGMPATILRAYLYENGVVVEKAGLYSFSITFTIGITKGRWNSMVSVLQQFKDDYDRNRPLWRIMPKFTYAYTKYEQMSLKDLCQELHEFYVEHNIAHLLQDISVFPATPVLKPSDAFQQIAKRNIDRIQVDHDLVGRISVTLVSVGNIPLLVPGEVYHDKIVEYLIFIKNFSHSFPGFEPDVHGIIKERGNNNSSFVFLADVIKVVP